MSHPDNGQFFKNCTFNSFLRLLGPQIVPPTAPDWFESISRVQCKSRIKSWDDDVTTWSLKDHVVTLCLRTISVRLKSECIQKLIKHLYFVHLFRYPAKKSENVKKYNWWNTAQGGEPLKADINHHGRCYGPEWPVWLIFLPEKLSQHVYSQKFVIR